MPNPPKMDPQRGARGRGVMRLPAEGRKGGPPPWPASGRMTKPIATAWAELWATPQAVMWERLGWTREVARYCRLLLRAEQPASTAAVHAQATALADRLGLTPKAMRLLLWEIVPDELAEVRAEQSAPATTTRGRHLNAVDPAAAAADA